MIAYNRKHARVATPSYSKSKLKADMPPKYRKAIEDLEKTVEGRKALAKFRKFHGIPYPTNIKVIQMPGPKSQKKILVGMGRAGKGGKIIKKDGRKTSAKGARYAATDANGKRIYLLTGRNSSAPSAQLADVGVVEETHYVPTEAQEKAGSKKRNKYWVHRHDDDGGKFPRVKRDQAGNYIYEPGTYSVSDWIRR